MGRNKRRRIVSPPPLRPRLPRFVKGKQKQASAPSRPRPGRFVKENKEQASAPASPKKVSPKKPSSTSSYQAPPPLRRPKPPSSPSVPFEVFIKRKAPFSSILSLMIPPITPGSSASTSEIPPLAPLPSVHEDEVEGGSYLSLLHNNLKGSTNRAIKKGSQANVEADELGKESDLPVREETSRLLLEDDDDDDDLFIKIVPSST